MARKSKKALKLDDTLGCLNRLAIVGFLLAWWGGGLLSAQEVRIATFNTSLYRERANHLADELKDVESIAARKVAEILQTVRPDVVLLNEFDYDVDQTALSRFKKNYLEIGQNGRKPLFYKHCFLPPVNTGLPSGLDLDRDGKTGGPGDAWGFGKHAGQYGMVVLSKYPIESARCRTFQQFLWKDMPNALLPQMDDKSSFYPPEILKRMRLSSKNHCDVVIRIETTLLHFLVSHPTPPVFDGKEDRNGRRNHDEIRFWSDYVSTKRSSYIYDDNKKYGGLAADSKFVIAGDLNADPRDGDSTGNPIGVLAANPRVNFMIYPESVGAVEASRRGAANRKHLGPARLDTADFNDETVGNLRTDYVLPSANLKVKSAGVFWPKKSHPQARLVSVSDHRLVWLDLDLSKASRQ